jgi:hypothetical protein
MLSAIRSRQRLPCSWCARKDPELTIFFYGFSRMYLLSASVLFGTLSPCSSNKSQKAYIPLERFRSCPVNRVGASSVFLHFVSIGRLQLGCARGQQNVLLPNCQKLQSLPWIQLACCFMELMGMGWPSTPAYRCLPTGERGNSVTQRQ